MADYKNRAGGRREYGAAPSRRTERRGAPAGFREERRGARRGPAVQGDARRPQTPQHRPAPARQPEAEVEERSLPENLLMGRNPVREAIRAGRSIDKLLVADGEMEGSARELLRMAKEAGIIIQQVGRAHLDELCMGGRHQGFAAFVAVRDYVTLAEMLAAAREKGEDPFIVVLDGVEDPHNLGSIMRTAECCGAHGIVIPKRRAVGMTPIVAKASAGAVEYLPVARVTNLNTALEELKSAGVWITGADMSGQPYYQCDFKGSIALVVGGEGQGISQLLKKNCDFVASIPMQGKIESLNASVAAAVLMCEAARQRSL